jgi:hypothetical protein
VPGEFCHKHGVSGQTVQSGGARMALLGKSRETDKARRDESVCSNPRRRFVSIKRSPRLAVMLYMRKLPGKQISLRGYSRKETVCHQAASGQRLMTRARAEARINKDATFPDEAALRSSVCRSLVDREALATRRAGMGSGSRLGSRRTC